MSIYSKKKRAFKLVSSFSPTGDQPQAIEALVSGLMNGRKHQVLLGVTGSGKTFTMAHIIARMQLPTLVIAPNKTLAAQLYGEFRTLFPQNAIEYFVSYYDYYQPEAYLPPTDTYIAKDASINEAIDKMRHSATRALLERDDVIIVASVSCIYGLGSPEQYHGMLLHLNKYQEISREEVLEKLVEIHYLRNDYDFHRGTFRVRGDVVEIFPAYEEDQAVRIEFFGDEIDAISDIDPLTGETIRSLDDVSIYPGSHYVTDRSNLENAMASIREEAKDRIGELYKLGKLVEAQRLEERTMYDLEMMQELGYCSGIENYSRHLTGRKAGEPPPTLIDYFPENWLLFIDESHITLPQLRGMYRGDHSRKKTLVEYGFRLPSALDNRPLCFEEFEEKINQVIYLSATPGDNELEKAEGEIVEQLIRPTGLLDPEIEIRPAKNQVDDLLGEIRKRVSDNERVLVTTLTKRMAEDLTEYFAELGIKVRYMHSDIKTLDRVELIRDLRLGNFDVLVGINLLREGLDLPEVSLVAILDADKEGFLRSDRSLIQTVGRAARNLKGKVILYGDKTTSSMERTVNETNRRRTLQAAYNQRHHVKPTTIYKEITDLLAPIFEPAHLPPDKISESQLEFSTVDLKNLKIQLKKLEKQMREAADNLEFEKAARIRDRIKIIRQAELLLE